MSDKSAWMGNLCSQKYMPILVQSQRVKTHRMTIIGHLTGLRHEKMLLENNGKTQIAICANKLLADSFNVYTGKSCLCTFAWYTMWSSSLGFREQNPIFPAYL